MLQKKYKSELISIINPLEGIYTLEFASLSGKYKYHPGQFLHIAIDKDYDGTSQWPDSRCFSMQSSPDEKTIKITYAVKGQFTKQMGEQLKVGSEIWLKLPYGDLFTQPHNKTNTVFIAGGTGITPFLSLFTHESFNEYINPRVYLGFRSKDHHIYHEELGRMNQIREIRNNSCNSDECNSSSFVKSFIEETDGVIDIEEIFLDNGIHSNYFISGPPAMIKAFKQALITKDVPQQNVLTDDWE
ncbi:MAG: FAD-dependent oxidoreductase [Bacteroidales bacterium]|nr:FAD-dependent oxidoreductase [Bacteroidales bacterium]